MEPALNKYEPFKLKPVGPDIWQADGDFVYFHNYPYPIRMFLVRLTNGHYLINTPVQPDKDLVNEIKTKIKSMKVLYIISGSKHHNNFLESWSALFPEARLGGPLDLIDKMQKDERNLKFTYVLDNKNTLPWNDDLAHLHIEGCRICEEVFFYHKKSKSLVIADLIQNHRLEALYTEQVQKRKEKGKSIKYLQGCPEEHKDNYSSTDAKKKLLELLKQVLQWDFDKILITHGNQITEDAKEYYETFLSEF